MAAEVGPALGLTAESKSLVVATEDMKDLSKAAHQAEAAAEGLAGGTKRMSQSMMAALASLRSMDSSLTRLVQAQRQNNTEGQEAERRAAALRAQYASLRASMDPVYATSKRYESALETLNSAQAAGVISDQERARSLAMLDAQFGQAAIASQKMATNSMQTANMFAQLNDVGVMAFSGQAPWMLAIQQGPQVNQILFDIMQRGGGAKDAMLMLGNALRAMVSPMSMLTLGVIAGTAALIQWGLSAQSGGEKAMTLSERMDSMSSSAEAYASSLEASKQTTVELVQQYGMLAGFASEALKNIASVEQAKALREIDAALKETISSLIRTVDVGGIATPTLVKDLGLAGQQASNLAAGLYRVQLIQDTVARAAAASDLSREMLAAYGSVNKMPPEMQDVYGNLQRIITATGQATSESGAWASSLSSVLSYVNAIAATMNSLAGGGIQLAAIKTETELLRQGKSLREASYASAQKTAELEGAKRTAELKAQYGVVGEWLGKAEAGQKMAIVNAQQQLDIEREAAREREKAANKAGGTAAAELKAAKKGFQTIRELLEEDSLFQFAEHEKRQAQLDAALSKQLVTRQAYAEMTSQLRTMYFGSEWEQQALRYTMDQEALKAALDQKLITYEEYYLKLKEMQWANLLSEDNRSDLASDLANWGSYFGQLNTLAGGGFDGLLRAQRVFSASSALINTWLGYSEALANNPLMPPWMKLAWAGKILTAGLGAVSAIKGASKGGGGGGVGSSVGSSSAQAAPAETPLRVSADAFDPAQLYTGEAVQKWFDAIQAEAGNRGITWVPV